MKWLFVYFGAQSSLNLCINLNFHQIKKFFGYSFLNILFNLSLSLFFRNYQCMSIWPLDSLIVTDILLTFFFLPNVSVWSISVALSSSLFIFSSSLPIQSIISSSAFFHLTHCRIYLQEFALSQFFVVVLFLPILPSSLFLDQFAFLIDFFFLLIISCIFLLLCIPGNFFIIIQCHTVWIFSMYLCILKKVLRLVL